MTPLEFAHALDQFLEQNQLTQKTFAEQVGISQPRLSEWKNGKMKRLPSRAKVAVSFIEDYRKCEKSVIPDEIQKAVKGTWDGTDAHAKAIATVIESLAGLRC